MEIKDFLERHITVITIIIAIVAIAADHYLYPKAGYVAGVAWIACRVISVASIILLAIIARVAVNKWVKNERSGQYEKKQIR